MDENLLKYGQADFTLPHDIVKLPSGGKFYTSKKKSVKIGYLTASDENLLMGSNPNETIMTLVRNKLYEPDIKPDDLLNGDLEAILIFLRNTSFGPEYIINTVDPQTNKVFQATLSLEELDLRVPSVLSDDNGTWTVTLPKSQAQVTLRPLTYGEINEITKQTENYPQNRIAPRMTWRLQKQIVSVNGDNTPQTINKFIETMPILDSKFIRRFIDDNEPKIELKRTILAPSGSKVDVEITFGAEFFRVFF
jgi:hypothetical protein